MQLQVTRSIRLINYIIDYVFILLITIFLSAGYFISTWEMELNGDPEAIFYFIYLVSFFFYYLLCELIWQRTLGKLFTGTKVINLNNQKPGWRQILIRSWIRTISINVLSFIWTNTGHHDLLSDTRVVRIK